MTDGRAVLHPQCQVVGDQRRCAACLELKDQPAFSNDRSRPGGKFPYCKTCQSVKNRSKQGGDPNGHSCPLCDTEILGHPNRRFCSPYCKDRVKALRDRFGLTVEQYRRLVDATDGLCPICTKPTSRWHVDHDHSSGHVTGVVCGSCNIGALARTYHDPAFVQRLLDYLQSTPASQLGIEATAAEAPPSTLHEMWPSRRAGLVPPKIV